MRHVVSVLLLSAIASGSMAQSVPSASSDLLGYTSADAKTEHNWETRFQAIPQASRAHENMRFLAAHPHNVGTEAHAQERRVDGRPL